MEGGRPGASGTAMMTRIRIHPPTGVVMTTGETRTAAETLMEMVVGIGKAKKMESLQSRWKAPNHRPYRQSPTTTRWPMSRLES